MLHPTTSSSSNPPGYTTKVSFDTLENDTAGDTAMFSYTLQVGIWPTLLDTVDFAGRTRSLVRGQAPDALGVDNGPHV